MRTYVDTSAVIKLVFAEPESEALSDFLDAVPGEGLFSSALLLTEARRSATRNGAEQSAVTTVLDSVTLLDVTRSLLNQAGLLAGSTLRSLDAIHLSTALHHGADLFIAYDHRLLEAAHAQGLPTASPA